uniref:Endolytic murein transglycosylase n=1 Tax=Desulfatirhabdium butyrativorans TaxID=340467 RepID=A0A7C4VRP1_9BACT
MKPLLTTVSVLLMLILGTIGVHSALECRRHWKTPIDPNGRPILIDIPKGQSFAATAAQLHRAGLIGSPLCFRVAARMAALDHRVKAGEYRLSASMSPEAILEKLASGEVALHSLVIPEGYTMQQIAEVIDRSGISDGKAFLEAATDPAVCARLQVPAGTLEGYLFPDTYLFPKNTPAMTIVQTMVQRFRARVTPAMIEQAERLGMSLHQIVILASMIEKETGVDAERSLVSSVFHNRLKRGMRLESDPTAVYGVADLSKGITREHLQAGTLYNTYRISGLPHGPIANPGLAALTAALYPAQTDYLYFVARDERNHRFSRTWAEHEKAVQAYRSFRK